MRIQSAFGSRYPVQRLCDQGHPYHDDGPCPFNLIDPPRRAGGGRSFRSIYTTPETPQTAFNNLAEAGAHEYEGVGQGYGGPVEVRRAPSTPIAASVPTRNSGNTATAFRRATGDPSAAAHVERFGYSTAPYSHNRTHLGGYGQHGLSADRPGNIVAATTATNGIMIPTDNSYPPGFIDLNEAEVQPGSEVAHRIHQAIAHPDAPDVPLFRTTHDAFRGSLTGGEWDDRAAWAKANLNPETLNTAHYLHMLNPPAHPTMDQIRDEEDTERTAARLAHLLYSSRGDYEEDDTDMSDDEEEEKKEDDRNMDTSG